MSDHRPRDPGKLQRQKRLEDELRENLKRRRQQARARRETEAAEPDETARNDSATLDRMS